MKKIIMMLGLAAALCSVLAISCKKDPKYYETPDSTVQRFWDCLSRQDYDGALDCMDIKDADREHTKEVYKEKINAKVNGGYTFIGITDNTYAIDVKTGTAQYNCKVLFKDKDGKEETLPQTYKLVQKNGEWKIDASSFETKK